VVSINGPFIGQSSHGNRDNWRPYAAEGSGNALGPYAGIMLQGDDPNLVNLMITYIYTLRYPESNGIENVDFDEDLILHPWAYAVAARYHISGLKVAAAEELKSLLAAVTTRQPEVPLHFIRELLPVVYETTPPYDRACRNVLPNFSAHHKHQQLVFEIIRDYAHINDAFRSGVQRRRPFNSPVP
jgi:hypothetical protein